MKYKRISKCCVWAMLSWALAGAASAQVGEQASPTSGAGLVPPHQIKSVVASPSHRKVPNEEKYLEAQRWGAAQVVTIDQGLRRALTSQKPLTNDDESWLQPLRELWGRDSITIPDPDNLTTKRTVDCRLSVDYINGHPGSLQALGLAWEALKAASVQAVQVFVGNGYDVPVANASLAALMRDRYTSATFADLYAAAKAKGCFNLKINDKNGLVVTSDIPGAENKEMAERQWVTDTVRAGDLERYQSPSHWPLVLQTLARFYNNDTEQAAFDKAISNPDSYRLGGASEGVAHIFYPNTLERDPEWFNNKRLESHGLALRAFVEGIIAGARDKAEWGVEAPSEDMLQAIANLGAYFVSIGYYDAPSAGNWEETPFPGGLTWDSAVICLALNQLDELLYSDKYADNQAILEARRRILAAKHGEVLRDRQRLSKAIADGKGRVRRTYMAESPGKREIDSSLVFLSQNDISLDDNAFTSIAKYAEQLDMLRRELVRPHGMIRYAPFKLTLKDGSVVSSPDSYLNLNYNIACDPQGKINLQWKSLLDTFGSKDASEPEVFAARASLATDNCEAEWFMISDLACGYACQGRLLLRAIADRQGGRLDPAKLTFEERKLLRRLVNGATESINRAYARITAEYGGVKANGQTAPAWAVPEAWQCVSTMQTGQKGYLPGVNTPLTWAAVSLWGASEMYSNLLKDLEDAGIDIQTL